MSEITKQVSSVLHSNLVYNGIATVTVF